MRAPKHILVVDHDGDVRQVIDDLLCDIGYRVSVSQNDGEMRALLDAGGVDLIVLDASTDNTPGLDIALDAKERGIRLVVISGHPEMMQRFEKRVDQLLWKPFTSARLARAVNHAFDSETFGQRKEDPD